MIRITDTSCQKPRNFSRKVFICSCEVSIIASGISSQLAQRKTNLLDKSMVKYEVEPNKDFNYQSIKGKSYWGSYEYWGKFKNIVELPKIFEKLDDDEYVIYTGLFIRDNVQMPCVYSIEILNVNKYLNLKKQEERKKKLKNINKN